jgi:hypothetical protein
MLIFCALLQIWSNILASKIKGEQSRNSIEKVPSMVKYLIYKLTTPRVQIRTTINIVCEMIANYNTMSVCVT